MIEAGLVVNSKKVRRLTREHDLQPKRRKRFSLATQPFIPPLFRTKSLSFSPFGLRSAT